MTRAFADDPLRQDRPALAWLPLLGLAAVRLLLQAVCLTEYGWFRDELYYVASTRHLALGYVDHPPLSIALLAGWTAIFGSTLVAVRLLAALIASATIVLAGAIAREIGGRAFAQTLAALAVLAAPTIVGSESFYSMNGVDHALSALAILLYARLLRRGDGRTAAALGAVLGLALLNKLSALWLVAGMLAGVLLTRHRHLLARRPVWVGAAIAALLFLPHVLWQLAHGFPTAEFMRNAARYKMVESSPLQFWSAQLLEMNPLTAPVWIAGVIAPLAWRPLRPWAPLALVFVTVASILMLGASKTYYLVIAYFAAYAAGAVAIERWTAARRGGGAVRGALVLGIAAFGALGAPLALPLLPKEEVGPYLRRLGIEPRAQERHERAALPQHFADMHGWPELVDAVERAAARLSPEERQRAVVFGQNYGEAGAIDVLGAPRGLPPAISGHNSYWMWGPGRDSVEVVIVIGGDLEDNRAVFYEFEIVDSTRCEWCMPYENGLPIGIGRRPWTSLRSLWPQLRTFI